VAGAFQPAGIQPAIAALATGGSENPAYKPEALSALAQAIEHAYHGQAWVFTDGTPDNTPTVEDVSRRLQDHDMQASIALLAGGGASPTPGDEAPTAQDAAALKSWRAAVRQLLGPAVADSIDASLLPYLYTAVNSGGQFLYVSESQLADAGDVLLAQLTHSAGAGRWSDYVSTTYRWNNLPSWEYHWYDATIRHQPGHASRRQLCTLESLALLLFLRGATGLPEHLGRWLYHPGLLQRERFGDQHPPAQYRRPQ
jgi:hypothetical protein